MTDQWNPDVAIIGGGPAGSTCASMIRKYNPDLEVLVLEKEAFPRDHVGESQLPGIGQVLAEIGAWDKIEAAGFPIKIGATYRWGLSPDLWDFDFVPAGFADEPRPARYAGQRRFTAFQVDRAIYDEILLDHAAEMGARVEQRTRVTRVDHEAGRITGLQVSGPGGDAHVTAKHYIDASGHVGVLRRALDVPVEVPTALRNIAFWDYWEDAEWAVTVGTGGTRVQILSIDNGWIWFIPISNTRTSIGLITNADYYKGRVDQDGITPEKLYEEALARSERVTHLTRNATRGSSLSSTKDWSFLSERMSGENWFLAGESAGFADPILAGGMMLAHMGARECAYAVLELERGEHDAGWLRSTYTQTQRKRIGQHIRFADFWYAGNGQFPDLQEHARKIAADAGLKLDARSAFRWLSTGGLGNDALGFATVGGLDIAATKEMISLFVGEDPGWSFNSFNMFRLDLAGATKASVPYFDKGRIVKADRYERGDATLPIVGMFAIVCQAVTERQNIRDLVQWLQEFYSKRVPPGVVNFRLQQALQVIEVMHTDGWLVGTLEPDKPQLRIQQRPGEEGGMIRPTAAARPGESRAV